MARQFIKIPLTDIERSVCLQYGRRMKNGHVGLGNVKYGDTDNVENYTDGKIGEYAVWKWFRQQQIPILHTPFRQDYSHLMPQDDFIIRLRDQPIQVEVRHKTRNVLPQPHYEHCSDRISTQVIYIFTERQRLGSRPQLGHELTLNHFAGIVHLIGWIDPVHFRQHARFTPAGTPILNDAGQVNFMTHRDEFNIRICDLYELKDLLTDRYDAWLPKCLFSL